MRALETADGRRIAMSLIVINSDSDLEINPAAGQIHRAVRLLIAHGTNSFVAIMKAGIFFHWSPASQIPVSADQRSTICLGVSPFRARSLRYGTFFEMQ